MRFPRAALVVLGAASLTLAQVIDPAALPECARTCLDNMQNKFGDFQCSSRDDFLCLCQAPDWLQGIADCARSSCEGGDASAGFIELTAYANEQCAAVTGGAPEEPQSTPPAEPTQAPPESTQPPTPETTSEPSAAPTAVADPTTESSSAPTTLLTSTRSSGSTGGSTSSSDAAGATGSSDAAANSEADTEAEGQEDGEGGLSLGAKIGIGVGGGAAFVICAALIIALLVRRRDRKRNVNEKDLNISGPMPGSGRSYASDDADSTTPAAATAAPIAKSSSGRSELELTSTRYEDMVPRAQPSLTRVRN